MFLQMTSLDENQYFFDSTRQASHSLKKAKKAKEGHRSRRHLPFVEIMAVFTSFILLFSQCSCSPLPGDVQEEALAKRDPGQRSSRRPHVSFSSGIQPNSGLLNLPETPQCMTPAVHLFRRCPST